MASSGWRANRPLKSLVFEHYGRFNVHQLVRLLQWRPRDESDKDRDGGRDGRDYRDDDNGMQAGPVRRLRFRAELSAAFPGDEVTRLSVAEPPPPSRLDRLKTTAPAQETETETIEFRTPNYCVASVTGPLPEPFTEWVREQEKSREHAMARFLDLFNQRLNVLRFDLKARQAIGLNNLPPEQTPHAHYLASIMGLGQAGMADQVPLPPRALLGLAGLLANTRKSVPVITQILSLFLGAKVALTEMVGAWQQIEEDDRIALGKTNHRLGRRTVLGRRVWDQQARVRLDVEPLGYEPFCRLLPPNLLERFGQSASNFHSHHDEFAALLRLLLDRLCDCEVWLRVPVRDLPESVLRADPDLHGGRNRGMRLGQTAWLNGDRDPYGADGAFTIGFVVHAYDAMPEAA